MRVLLVDDEPLARENLVRMLSPMSDVEIVGEAANGVEALEKLGQVTPDAIFLDIEMPGLNGFEVLDNLVDPPLVVFATAYDEYAIRAFEAHAVDYLLKPVRPERVAQSVQRLRNLLTMSAEPVGDAIRVLLQQMRPERPSKIAAKRGNRIVLISPRDLLRISAQDKLVFAHTAKEQFTVDKTVTEFEERLRSSGFFRVNRGDLVNLEHVVELMPWFSGTWRVKLSNGTEIDVARDRAKGLKQELNV